MSITEDLARAKGLLAQGERHQALTLTRRAMAYGGGAWKQTPVWLDGVQLLSDLIVDFAPTRVRTLLHRLDPNHPDQLSELGEALHQQCQFQLAASFFARARMLEPEDTGVLVDLVWSLQAACQFALALEILEEAQECDRAFVPGYYRAYNLLMCGHWRQSLQAAQTLQPVGPEQVSLLGALLSMLDRCDRIQAFTPSPTGTFREHWFQVVDSGRLTGSELNLGVALSLAY
ncbi:hypothetical protein JST97_03345 [bacterium]|nr:hypothetical protein [bacterium]